MKKSEIREMANACVNKYSNLSGVEKTFLFHGCVMGAMEMLYKLGIEVTVDTEE